MYQAITSFNSSTVPQAINWPAVYSLFLGVTSLIAAEFIPISLLTPIARDLNISEGLAGQSITVVGVFAVISSLLIAPLTKSINRKPVLVCLSILLVISNMLVAIAPNYPTMLLGRGILGICVGGFWSMASAVTLQLAPAKDIARALGTVYAGVSVATLIALPLSSYLGSLMGWRNVFLLAALLGLIALGWQIFALPQLNAQVGNNFKTMFHLLGRSWVLLGILATILSYSGYHIFFSYLRPFLQVSLQLSPSTVTKTLLIFGVANCVGTVLAGYLLSRYFKGVMLAVHFLLAINATLLLISHELVVENIVLAISWGFFFGFIPVGWSTWITKTLADKAELVGGLSVASIQLSIGVAAALGGLLLDRWGVGYVFVVAAAMFLGTTLLILVSFSVYKKTTGISL